MRLGDFEAWIRVDGQYLDEYEAQVSADGKTVMCWIPSEEGKHFSVCWVDNGPRYHGTKGYISFDGHAVGNRFIRPAGGMHGTWKSDAELSVARISPTQGYQFKFVPLELTDDETVGATIGDTEHLGEVELAIWYITLRTQTKHYYRPNAAPNLVQTQTGKVHESSKKAGSHRVHLTQVAQGRPGSGPSTFSVKRSGNEPICTFIFKYRPLSILRAKGIAPRSTSRSETRRNEPPPLAPVTVASDDPPKPSFTPVQLQEIKDLETRISELRHQAISHRLITKLEPISHQGIFEPGEIIDLT